MLRTHPRMGLEPGVGPVGDIVPKIERYVRIRTGTVEGRACSAVPEAVGRSFHYHKVLIGARGAFIDYLPTKADWTWWGVR